MFDNVRKHSTRRTKHEMNAWDKKICSPVDLYLVCSNSTIGEYETGMQSVRSYFIYNFPDELTGNPT